MSRKKTVLTLALGALGSAAGIALTTPVQASDNPFSAQVLKSGYLMAEAKTPEGKCGEGNCGASKKGAAKADSAKDKKADMKATDKAMPEGKCGEGKCAGTMKKDSKKAAPDTK